MGDVPIKAKQGHIVVPYVDSDGFVRDATSDEMRAARRLVPGPDHEPGMAALERVSVAIKGALALSGSRHPGVVRLMKIQDRAVYLWVNAQMVEHGRIVGTWPDLDDVQKKHWFEQARRDIDGRGVW